MANIKISTDQVEDIATNLERLNTQLSDLLKQSHANVTNLRNVWSGEASEATINAYETFSKKYFQQYEDTIKAYITFLRTNVASGYFEQESTNTSVGSSFL